MNGNQRRTGAATLLVTLLVIVGCAPDTGVGAPTWTTTHVSRVSTPTSSTNYVGAWTSESWASTLQIDNATGSPGSATLLLFPRSGPGNSVLGTPQNLTPTIVPNVAGPMGRSFIGLPGSVNGDGAVEFFVVTAGVWSSAGVTTLPAGQHVMAVGDEWLVTRATPMNPGTPGRVFVTPLVSAGATITTGTPVELAPDPAWSPTLIEGFGGPGAAIDGNLLVVGAQGQFAPAPGAVRVYRAVAGVWTPVLSLGAAETGPNGFGKAIAVDDGPTVDRIALGPQSDTSPVVDVYADSGSGFALEQTITRVASDPDEFSGLYFGAGVALDDDLLAVTSRAVLVPSADPAHAAVKVGYVSIYRHGATWTREAEVPAFTNPAPAATISSLPFRLTASGNHVGVYQLVTPDPPPGCQFPCFNIGFEAWSIDRTG